MSEPKTKIQLNLDAEARKILLDLVARTSAESMAEVLRDALGVYNSLHDMLAKDEGNRLALVNREAGTMQELNIPTLTGRWAH